MGVLLTNTNTNIIIGDPSSYPVNRLSVIVIVKNTIMPSIVSTPVHLANEYDAIPLPADFFPNGYFDLSQLSGDEIMSIPPHLIVHIHRTNSQNGLQVISPRQVPSTNIVKRVRTDSAASFVHLAGSDALSGATWNVPKGSRKPDESVMEDEPMKKAGAPLAERTPARVDPLVHILDGVVNPVDRAWIKSRANVDLQMSDSVGGSSEDLATAIEKRFGAEEGALMKDPGLVAIVSPDLLHHALVVDNSMARELASVQARRVITVAVGPSSNEALGAYRAFDWTCARVTAGAKFHLTVINEGHSLTTVSSVASATVGELLQRPMSRGTNVLAYHPTPATVWNYEPHTFSIHADASKMTRSAVPSSMVRRQLMECAETVSPIVSALAHNATVSMTRSRVDKQEHESKASARDSFGGFYSKVSGAVTKMTSIGKTGAKALRSEIFSALTSASAVDLAKMVKALSVVQEFVDYFGDVMTVSEGVISALATRVTSMDTYLHAHMCGAAVIKHEDPDEWFATLSGQTTGSRDSPGSKGWAKMAIRFMLKPPNKKWRDLLGALKRRTIQALDAKHRVSFSTVPEDYLAHDAAAAVLMKATVARRKAVHCASYDGAALGSVLCARMADEEGFTSVAKACRVNAAGWTLRQRFLARTYVSFEEVSANRPGTPRTWVSKAGIVESGKPVRISTRVTPHSAYSQWRDKIGDLFKPESVIAPKRVLSGGIAYAVRMTRPVGLDGRELSDGEIVYLSSSDMESVSYAMEPSKLAAALERNLDFIHKDAVEAVEKYSVDARKMEDKANAAARASVPRPKREPIDMSTKAHKEEPVVSSVDESLWKEMEEVAVSVERNGWYWLTKTSSQDSQYIMDCQPNISGFNEIMSMTYPSRDVFLCAFDEAEEAEAQEVRNTGDALA